MMTGIQPIDGQLLDEWITKSGYKVGYIIEKLGISRTAFDKKKKGQISFRKSEVYVLCDMLQIPNDEATKIFYPEG